MIIYKATNQINGKSYIGLTTRDLRTRQLEHERHLNTENTYFHKAIKKYGKENFKWEIIDSSAKSLKELKKLEEQYIQILNTYVPNGYNITAGGESNSFKNRRDYSYGQNPSAKPIINLTTMQIYDCMKRASEENNISITSLKKAIDKNIPTLNCYWDYYDKNTIYIQKIPTIEENKTGRKRVQNTITNEIFSSISAAAKHSGHSRKTIRDICNKQKNGNWKYIY